MVACWFRGDIHAILRPIHRGTLQFVGFDVLLPQIVYAPVRMTEEQRQQQLAAYGERLQKIGGEPPMTVGAF
jgi:NAD(P)H dehydrogenase (quinone)